VPFFDPGPWGGNWMRQRFCLPNGPPNYAWCFDCVPEENSIVFGFGTRRFELPANVLVHEKPEELLGDCIYERFGAEFPIRFDLLDTMDGGNLSLQVHPMAEYIREHFGMDYTQDESYYILDRGEGSELYLGLRNGIDPAEMRQSLNDAQKSERPFSVERFVNTWPTRKHDHFPIPAGTIHCSGKENVVLEISATPYIFTFKLWDWGRLGLDGKPRPIHLEHGLQNIQWNRTTDWVRKELIDQVEQVGKGEGWCEELTGLHASEFLETRRHWFVEPVLHDTRGNLNVLNLVEGEEAVIESPTSAFSPMHVHYAETFILPAAVGEYTIKPLHAPRNPLATIKAYVRDCSPERNKTGKAFRPATR
jgi:mannose-6-phosphate isomerase class I